MERKFKPKRISSHPLLTPERKAELDALAEQYNTPEARAEARQEILIFRLQKRIAEMEQELHNVKEELNSLASK